MRPRVERMAFKARLYPDRADLLPKMLLGIADDVRNHFVSQGIFRLIVDGNVRQSRCSFAYHARWKRGRCGMFHYTKGPTYAARRLRHSMPKAFTRRDRFGNGHSPGREDGTEQERHRAN